MPDTEAVTAESLGWQLRSALPPMRLHSISIYNNEADVLWLSEGALGPDEHNVVVEAIEHLQKEKGTLYHELGMEDGRIAIFLGLRGPRMELVGTVMILADMKSLSEGTMERVLTVPVKTLMQKLAVFLRKQYPQANGGDTSIVAAMPAPVAAKPVADVKAVPDVKLASAPTAAPTPGPPAAAKNSRAQSEPLAPKQVDAILTLELVEEPPAPPAAPKTAEKPKGVASVAVPAPAPIAAKPIVKAVPKKVQPLQAGPAAKSAAAVKAPATDIEVLTFDAEIQIPTAHPAPAAAGPAAEIEVLDFDAELTMPPTRVSVAQAAPLVEPPTAKAASAVKAASVAEPPVAKAAPAAKAAAVAEPPAAKAAPIVEPPVVKAARVESPASKVAPLVEPAAAAKATSSAAATVSVPVLNLGSTTTSKRVPASPDEEVLLIQDTGPVKKLELPSETSVEPELPASPPPPPLTVEETATDLSLYVQELIKLRSSGRTRRYEVLARSQRDAHRNEVPTAFIAEATKGREGAALDALVVERLLQWLGQHGETIWDSEPASFSVNLSIGALEDEHFVEKIAGWLKQYNVEAEYVGFEISEFACVQSRPAVLRFVDACEKLGCFLVIDNFSFDSNMFELLGSKTLRHVKIDPKLTSAAMKEKLPQALVVAILQACKVLGVHCVAKRIESQASLQWLTAVGCDFAQTFQLEKPRAIETLVSGKAIKALRE